MKANKLFGSLDELVLVLPATGTVVTTGAFDVPHVGHRRYLRKAREFGNVLVVILQSDDLIKRRKGESRPINSELTRAKRMSGKAYKYVNYVFIAKSYEELNKAIQKIHPEALVVSETTEDIETCPKTMIELFGKDMKVIVLPAQSELHSSDIIKRRKLKK